jgi:hypothetical protein
MAIKNNGKKLICRIAQNFGNQLFMYAHAYALSKKLNYNLYIDNLSSYSNSKNFHNFHLNRLNISARYADSNLIFETPAKNIKRKILKFIDKFRHKKKFCIEKFDKNKITDFFDTSQLYSYDSEFYVEGHYESEKYFVDYKEEIIKEFKIKTERNLIKNKYLEIINNNNVVSICVRQNRFSEKNKSQFNLDKSNQFLKRTIDYIYKAINFIEKKIQNPKYLLWSNDFANLHQFFDSNRFTFVENQNDKEINDLYLLSKCKYFIVGPTTFHWWGAWLSEYNNKICVRPPDDINPSNNKSFWPESWIKL